MNFLDLLFCYFDYFWLLTLGLGCFGVCGFCASVLLWFASLLLLDLGFGLVVVIRRV